MSRRSQEKRAARAKVRAKQRARDKVGDGHHGAGGPGGETDFFDWTASPPPPARMTTADVLTLARSGSIYGIWRDWANGIETAVFLADAEPVLVSWVRELYDRGGWQPTELIRHLSRFGKSSVAGLARVVVAAERNSRVGHSAKDPGWLRQWEAAGLPEMTETGWMADWAASHPDWMKRLYRFAMILGGMPPLEPLLPPSSGARASSRLASKQTPTSAHPMLVRVRALLAKAESTQYESEAIAFTAKAQELMTKHALDQAMLAGADAGPASPGVIRIPIDPPYLDAKALLLQVIAEHSRCQSVLHAGVEMSSVIGFSTDLEAVELLFTSLLVQAQHALAASSLAAPPGSRARSQSFRAAFLQGFISRIDARLASVNRVAFDQAKAQAETFLPVLRSRDEQISAFVEQRFSTLTSSRVRGGYDALGYQHGQRAGDAAALLSGAIEA